MPPFFKPVVIDEKRFIDGAFVNSIPADLVREMGADYIVGIDLSTRDAKPNLLSKLFPVFKSKVEEPWKKGYDNSDIMLHPDLSEFQAVSFWRGEDMFDIGYSLAIDKMPRIKADIEQLKSGKVKKDK